MVHEKLTKRINFLLGKNGCGKSTFLRNLENDLSNKQDWYVKYITPERGGALVFNAGVDQNIGEKDYIRNTRRVNRADQFRQQTISQYRNLELLILRKIDRDRTTEYGFQSVLEKINGLLPLIRLEQSQPAGFKIFSKSNNSLFDPANISSGESELIALAIEALVFSEECQIKQNRLLLLDEPDVHLHPDLQAKYIKFLDDLARQHDYKILIATHSTAIIGSIANKEECQLAFMPLQKGAEIEFIPIDTMLFTMVPIFGAHPLSNIFNESPILLIEGDDDKRIWDQVIRSTKGKIALYPCPVDSVDNLSEWETWLSQKLPALYDNPKAFSLRDGDGVKQEINDLPSVIRMRLNCYSAENMILSEDTLLLANMTWAQIIEEIKAWLKTYQNHPYYEKMKDFQDTGFNRRNKNLKDIRNILAGMLPVNKPWEILVGQAIAKLALEVGS